MVLLSLFSLDDKSYSDTSETLVTMGVLPLDVGVIVSMFGTKVEDGSNEDFISDIVPEVTNVENISVWLSVLDKRRLVCAIIGLVSTIVLLLLIGSNV